MAEENPYSPPALEENGHKESIEIRFVADAYFWRKTIGLMTAGAPGGVTSVFMAIFLTAAISALFQERPPYVGPIIAGALTSVVCCVWGVRNKREARKNALKKTRFVLGCQEGDAISITLEADRLVLKSPASSRSWPLEKIRTPLVLGSGQRRWVLVDSPGTPLMLPSLPGQTPPAVIVSAIRKRQKLAKRQAASKNSAVN